MRPRVAVAAVLPWAGVCWRRPARVCRVRGMVPVCRMRHTAHGSHRSQPTHSVWWTYAPHAHTTAISPRPRPVPCPVPLPVSIAVSVPVTFPVTIPLPLRSTPISVDQIVPLQAPILAILVLLLMSAGM